MKVELDEKLCTKYPKIFRERNSSSPEPISLFGFECSDGWYTLIDNLCGEIQAHIDESAAYNARETKYNQMIISAKNNDWQEFDEFHKRWPADLREERRLSVASIELREVPEVVEQVVAEQVKEKFGQLRFYYSGGDDVVHGMVRLAESLSGSLCEECGGVGRTVGKRWLRTLCKTHEEANNVIESQ